ncbi:MAG TPA: hypothetical protein VGC54_04860, partial [Planctomycetota bacterium]
MRLLKSWTQFAACAFAAACLGSSLGASPCLLQSSTTTPPDTGGKSGGAGGIDSGGDTDGETIIDAEGLMVNPDGSGGLASSEAGVDVAAVMTTEKMFTTFGELVLTKEDAELHGARFDTNGDMVLDDGRKVSATADLIVDEYVLPAGTL